jgi:hypothetical protein
MVKTNACSIQGTNSIMVSKKEEDEEGTMRLGKLTFIIKSKTILNIIKIHKNHGIKSIWILQVKENRSKN